MILSRATRNSCIKTVIQIQSFHLRSAFPWFETDERIGKYFETDIHADHVIAVLEKYYQVKIVPENTLDNF